MEAIWSLLGMFVAAFGAATLLPFQSEIVFVGLQLRGEVPLSFVLLAASVGNVLGSVVNYVLGALFERLKDRRWFPVTSAQMQKAHDWYAKWGVWSLLLSWAPFGDAITVVAGLLRTPFPLFLALVTLAKTGRYVFLALATAGLS
ncbi:YqaA family protein [Palleronia caenipelagi]|uniref:DedA family protein n=1 Tax=Palleronia caenipelagi TaxID=2489174 RepID=A0A547Q9T1_9RHOB|nr:YqaA family protein [Palleronia caenipelagi]TRD23111.1 DedA family protein [Palleronia caenipelagi]